MSFEQLRTDEETRRRIRDSIAEYLGIDSDEPIHEEHREAKSADNEEECGDEITPAELVIKLGEVLDDTLTNLLDDSIALESAHELTELVRATEAYIRLKDSITDV